MKIPIHNVVLSCTGCWHWQIDVHPRAGREVDELTWSVAEAHREHLDSEECANPDGRVKVAGRWVDRPTSPTSGKQLRGVMEVELLPRWWVWR